MTNIEQKALALVEALATTRDYVADVAGGSIHFNDSIKVMAAEDLTRIDAALAAWNTRQPTQSDVLKAAGDAIRGLLDIASDDNLDSAQAGRAYAALHDIDTALKKQSK